MSQAQYEQQGAAEQWHMENDMIDLLKLNVNEHTEKKNGLTYLSWAWAWRKVLELDPLAEWMPLYFGPETNQTPYLPMPDGSMMVGVTVHMKGKARQCMLPVMDHRNKAIKNPDAFAVNTAMMRCLAKAIAMHGLGLYIYAGEDLPEEGAWKQPMDELASQMVQLFYEEKNSIQAVKLWYDNEYIAGKKASNEAREYAWEQLHEYSALRSAIKANKPIPPNALPSTDDIAKANQQLRKEAGFARV